MGSTATSQSSLEQTYRGLRVLVTGHTGFCGSWLTLWLHHLGADVTGLSLAPNTSPSLFERAAVGACSQTVLADIGEYANVHDTIVAARPEVVFHLAAQPLVSQSFVDPVETFRTNVMGTAHVLEASRKSPTTAAVVCVTTDKVYRDQDWPWAYRETDTLGGKDPYAASKAAAELVAGSYQQSLSERGNGVSIATARGGNIVGGGDWAANRIIPDFVRSITSGTSLELRNPEAVRPWQHVLCLVHGYLVLAERLLRQPQLAVGAWNFGPSTDSAQPVSAVVAGLARHWQKLELSYRPGVFPETRFLTVDSSRARQALCWNPPHSFDDTIRLTAEWYRDFYAGYDARDLCLRQIAEYAAQVARQ